MNPNLEAVDLNFISQRENVVVINTTAMELNLNNKGLIFLFGISALVRFPRMYLEWKGWEI